MADVSIGRTASSISRIDGKQVYTLGADVNTKVITGGEATAIVLTSLTTFLGVTPIILETSVQAAFLIPTAISLGIGILFATIILIFLLPAVALCLFKLKTKLGLPLVRTLDEGNGAQERSEDHSKPAENKPAIA